MALPVSQVAGLQWSNYTGSAQDLIAAIVCDFTTYSAVNIIPTGGTAQRGLAAADGVVIDNLSSKETITLTIGQLVETIPPYTKGLLRLTPQMPQIQVTASGPTKPLLTFYTGDFRGTTGSTNYFNAQRQAQLEVSTGMIYEFAGQAANIPTGYLLCDGSPVSRVTYSGLFSIIGTIYGTGDGSTTFNLPNLSGRVAVGTGTAPEGGGNRAIGDSGGETAHALTIAELASHDHGVNDPGHTHFVRGSSAVGTAQVSVQGGTSDRTSTSAAALSAVTGITLQTNGSGAAHNNMQPFLALNRIIKT